MLEEEHSGLWYATERVSDAGDCEKNIWRITLFMMFLQQYMCKEAVSPSRNGEVFSVYMEGATQ